MATETPCVQRAVFPLGVGKSVELVFTGGPVTPEALQTLAEYLELWRRYTAPPTPTPPPGAAEPTEREEGPCISVR